MKRAMPWIIGVFAVVFLAWAAQRLFAPPPIPESIRTRVDSVRITQPAYQQQQETLKVATKREVAASLEAQRQSSIARASAHRAEARADSLARVAQQATDSATAWHRAYDARTEEAVQLRQSFASESIRADHAVSAQILADRRADNAEARATALMNLNNDLYRTLQRATECRLIGPIPCPTRTQAVVAGAIAGAVGGYMAHQAHP